MKGRSDNEEMSDTVSSQLKEKVSTLYMYKRRVKAKFKFCPTPPPAPLPVLFFFACKTSQIYSWCDLLQNMQYAVAEQLLGSGNGDRSG